MLLRLFVLAVIKASLMEAALKEFGPTNWPMPKLAMVWIDGRNRLGNFDIDTFFDRVVSLAYTLPVPVEGHHYKSETTGVIITNQHILSPYNPFRELVQEEGGLKRVKFTIITSRLFTDSGAVKTYFIERSNNLVCARQVHPTSPDQPDIPHMNHGTNKPTHDLMVWRLNKPIVFLEPQPPRIYVFPTPNLGRWVADRQAWEFIVGPIRTKLAKKGDPFTEELMFASLGHINADHIKEGRFLEKEEITSEEASFTDCDEWLPKEWGYFHCLMNPNEYPGISSGAPLFSKDLLIGMGAFALFRGKSSVLVFTDVRPYYDLVNKTCTEDDQNLVIPISDP